MITLHGLTTGSERLAAERLAGMFADLWPDVSSSRSLNIDLFVGAKLYGQKTKDVDIVVLIDFTADPKRIGEGEAQVVVRSACAAVEVKNHDSSRVKFEWNVALVKYEGSTTWKSVTEQAFKQKSCLTAYFATQSIRHIQVGDMVWLRGVLERDLPHQAEPHNIIAGDSTAADFIRRLAGSLGTTVLEATSPGNARELSLARGIIVSEVVPTACDRRRIEALYADQLADQSFAKTGEMLYVIRGKGGTGKTMTLLHNAWHLHHRDGLRVLILTYNKALRADLARQLTLMGVSEESGLAVQTVYSFLRRLYIELCYLEPGVGEDDAAFFQRMDAIGPEALRELKRFDPVDIERFRTSNSEFAWDLICIDEGQDWPQIERDLLGVLYGFRRLIVADGIDQLVRGREYCDWTAGLSRGSDYKVVPLERSKRMRANLAEFVNAIAVESGHPLWRLDTRGSIPGGTVLVVEGEYTNQRELHESLVRRNSAEGNENVDMLYCVSRDMVDVIDDDKSAFPAMRFQEWGYDVWDGTSKDVRDGFPVSNGQLRLVQYESCRGLEGWTVVAMALDRFLAAKRRDYEGDNPELNAFRWLMIPLTRAISHLVVTIDPGDSSARDLLRNVRQQLPGIVEWRSVG